MNCFCHKETTPLGLASEDPQTTPNLPQLHAPLLPEQTFLSSLPSSPILYFGSPDLSAFPRGQILSLQTPPL